MPVVKIDELEVQFPFEPYDVQTQLMTRVVECLRMRQNGLLESPTGTGKTLSLLCASLAWQRKQKSFISTIATDVNQVLSNHGFARPEAPGGSKIGGLNGNTKAVFSVPKIIYSSRTHSQLSQVMQELKRSYYKNSKAIILGSREQLCIHEQVSRLEGSSAKILACHVRVHAHTCGYYNNVNKLKDDPSLRIQTVVDIEDLVLKGKTQRFCPFYMSREFVQEADIVFMPYNYLLDPKLRASHGIDLKNCVVILDEGHNIAKICEESVSFEIKSSTVAHCIQELTKALNEYVEASQQIGNNALTKDLSLGNLISLKQSFLQLESELDKIPTTSEGTILPGQQLLSTLFQNGFPPSVLKRVIEDLDAVSSFLSGSNVESTGCDKFSSILRVLSSQSMFKNPAVFGESYKVFVHFEESKRGKDSRLYDSAKSNKSAKVFNFWCFNPAVGLETMMLYGPRCILLASGTLSPMSFLVKELQIPFPVQHTNRHIIRDNQLFASIVTCGPQNVRLSSKYETREDAGYLNSLGEVIRTVCSIVPKGVLVFFPSYYVMEICKRSWESTGLWARMQQHKKLLFEPRGKDSFKQVMDDYYAGVKTATGACLMAVCRGKVSEGLDFTDDNGRAVIITGIPYAPAKDPQVLAKQQYLNMKHSSGERDCINGSTWYQLEATRSVNQAIGRIIRHINDYGAILICDERCANANFKSNLSQWVQQRLTVSSNFAHTVRDLGAFFGSTVQQERIEHAKTITAKIHPSTPKVRVSRPIKSLAGDSQALLDTLTSQEVADFLDATEEDCIDVEEYNGAKKKLSQSSQSKKKEGSSAKRNSKDKSSLFGDLGTTSTTNNVANFNASVPVFPKPFAAFSQSPGVRASQDPHRKKIKLSSKNCSFTSSSNATGFSSSFKLTVGETATSSTRLGSLDHFTTSKDYWFWVKSILKGSAQAAFVNALKSYHEGRHSIDALQDQLLSLFPSEHAKKCIGGLGIVAKPQDRKKCKDLELAL